MSIATIVPWVIIGGLRDHFLIKNGSKSISVRKTENGCLIFSMR